MKKITTFLSLLIFTILFVGCANDPEESDAAPEEEPALEKETTPQEEQNDESPTADLSENDAGDDIDTTEESTPTEATKNEEPNNAEDNALSAYSSEEIEYARVWLQIIGNQDVTELNVSRTSAGEPVNPYDDNSVNYPEDIITLYGEFMAEGIVTYSGNGDGSINLYDVPSHWPSDEQIDESMEEYTENIINNTELISIDTGNEEEIIPIIDKLSTH
ncbi:hypothetical protein [Gracilibacillus phocaeensis]|uniref:hypothetical protein n=1 Tax=Gracilibacillus phocaeensis TaxID=2042304 RepID=UPI00103226C9|nr:hypothetical protein [Gracilibacillus phocaeensis]